MRVAAIGDAHLGRSYLPYTTEAGVNVREQDFELSFTAAVDLALAQEPELIVWLGDVFDHPRPTYRSFRVAQRALMKIRQHGIQLALISGNHDTPRLPGTGSPYSALHDSFPEFHFAHRLTYERFELPGLVVHAVPQMLSVEATLEALDQAAAERSADKTNLLLTHPRITQVEPKYADINEIEVDANRLQADFVVLGHYHVHTEVRPGVWYAGSTDSFTFADDPDEAKGILVLDTDTGAARHVPLADQRPLVTMETIMATGLSPTELQDQLSQRAELVPEGAVARVFVDGVDPQSWRLVDLEAVRAISKGLHFDPKASMMGVDARVELPDLESMGARWARYLDDQDLEGYDRDRIKTLGDNYLARAIEEAIP
jgi:DNA repair exonuclease SbcCD nuclease subunit